MNPYQSIADLGQRLRRGETSATQTTAVMLQRIDDHNAALNAFNTVCNESALTAARAADEELARGRDRGPLHGVPVAVKDLIDTAGIRTTGGAAIHAERVPDDDATVIQKLKAAGAVILGKTNLHELAYGTTSQNPHFGDVCNPWSLDRISGGSSGGSAVAVAAGLAYAAIGTDTGCSIRQPAHCCGIVGLKPTFGLVSKHGVMPLVWRMDHVGPMTRTVSDALLVLRQIAGFDSHDPHSIHAPEAIAEVPRKSLNGIRIGIIRRFFFDGYDDVIRCVDRAIDQLAARGAQLVELDIPDIEEASKASRIMFVEALAIHERTLEEQGARLSEEVRDKLIALRQISALEFARAAQFQPEFARRMDQLLTKCDVLCTPTATVPALPRHNLPDDYARNAWKNTCIFDYTGQPSISIPCGKLDDNMPVGMMLTAARQRDSDLLAIAQCIETSLGGFEPPDID
ncbi:MAG: amidase [Pseudomonadota bacterium]